eukprot:TRINITY_DN769_c0_g1_i2.p1 TRINITY_DN769_c0_g1~~TRINITY_DN769_c0_g1_i2.p1  ORF type:complete len:102 (-),score=26.30 TRINITY_DN769_c0_g1_i2:188-493(-)
MEELKSFDNQVPCIIVGTKTDLREDEKTIKELKKRKQKVKSREDGFDLKWNIKAKKYLECSSLKKEGVKEVFDEVIRVGAQFKREKSLRGKKKSNSKCSFL